MIAKRQFSPETATVSEPETPVAASDLAAIAGLSGDVGPARQLQAKLADAIAVSPQHDAWQVDFGHRSNIDTAVMPQLAKSITAGISGGAFIAVCLFMMLD